jgi:hypothetical protein
MNFKRQETAELRLIFMNSGPAMANGGKLLSTVGFLVGSSDAN